MSKPDLNQEAADGIVNRRFLRLNGYSHDEINVIAEKALSSLFADAADDRKAEVQRMADAIAASVRETQNRKDEQPADMGNPTSDLPYAIRVYDQARKVANELHDAEQAVRNQEDARLRRIPQGDSRSYQLLAANLVTTSKMRKQIKDAALVTESEVVKLAEKLMPGCVSSLGANDPLSWATGRAFQAAEEFIAERDARSLAIRTANVDSLLDQNNNQPKGG